MGMARNAPMDQYKWKHNMSTTALKAAREFLLEKKADLAFREDEDIHNEIDRCVSEARDLGNFKNAFDRNEEALIVDLKDSNLFKGLTAVLHKSDFRRIKREWSVITLVDKKDAEESWSSGRWHFKKPSPVVTHLKDKMPLTNVMEQTIQQAAANLSPLPTPTTEPVPSIPTPSVVGDQLRLVSWVDVDDAFHQKLCTSVAEASSWMSTLIEDVGVDPEDIRVFKPTWTEVKKKVKVELE